MKARDMPAGAIVASATRVWIKRNSADRYPPLHPGYEEWWTEATTYAVPISNREIDEMLSLGTVDLLRPPPESQTVWTVLSLDEASMVGVAVSADEGMRLAEEDLSGKLQWKKRSDGRFTSTTWDFEVRPFEVQRPASGSSPSAVIK